MITHYSHICSQALNQAAAALQPDFAFAPQTLWKWSTNNPAAFSYVTIRVTNTKGHSL
jgi:hypothetical protein